MHLGEIIDLTDEPMRCAYCGMLATIDPWLHEERYGHAPRVRFAGQLFWHDGRGGFVDEEGGGHVR